MNSIMFVEQCKLEYPNMDIDDLYFASRVHFLCPDITVNQFGGLAEMLAGYSLGNISDNEIISLSKGDNK